MGFWTATIWHYVFSGFSEKLSIFKNPFLAKSRRATKTHKMRRGAPTQIYFAIFPGAWFWAFPSKFSDRQPEKPILPAVLGMSALDGQVQTSYSPEARVRVHRSQSGIFLGRCLIFSMLPRDAVAYLRGLLRKLLRAGYPWNTVKIGISLPRTLRTPFSNA